jgi:hypothetical protein
VLKTLLTTHVGLLQHQIRLTISGGSLRAADVLVVDAAGDLPGVVSAAEVVESLEHLQQQVQADAAPW